MRFKYQVNQKTNHLIKDSFETLSYSDTIDKILLFIALISGFASSILYPSSFWFYGKVTTIINEYFLTKDGTYNRTCGKIYNFTEGIDLVSDVQQYMLYYALFGIAVAITHFIAYFAWGIASERQTIRLKNLLYNSIITQEISWFETLQFGEAANLFNSIDKIKTAYGVKLIDFIILMTRTLTCFIFGYYACWKLSLPVTVVLPLAAVFFITNIFLVRKYSIIENEYSKNVNSLSEEVIYGIKTVTSFNGQKFEINKYNRLLDSAKKITIKKGFMLGVTSAFFNFFYTLSYAIWIGYGTYVYRTDCNFEAGNIIQSFASLFTSTFAILQALPFLKEFSEGRIAAKSIFKIIKKKSKLDVNESSGNILNDEEFKGNINISKISFAYPSKKDIMALKELTMNIPSGKTVAICGSSGCGKSTLSKLILRLYEPLKGQILIDNHDIKNLNLKWWRNQISIVSQDAALFSFSVKDNIRMGRQDATDDEIMKASIAANAHDFIKSLKNGYDTILTKGGSELSGGQRQRIAIARAFLRNSKILIFDEATSALDNESERLIQESLKNLIKNKTTIIIAHRLSTIKDADIIFEMQNGCLTDSGTHDELMLKKGYYYNLVNIVSTENNNEFRQLENKSYKKISQNIDDEDDNEIIEIDEKGNKKSSIDNTKDKQETKIENIGTKVWKLNKPEWIWIILSSLSSLIQGATYPLIGFFFTQMFEIFSMVDIDAQTKISLEYTGYTIGLAFIVLFSIFVQNFATIKSGVELTNRVQKMLFKSIVYKDISWFESNKTNINILLQNLYKKPPMLKGYTGERVAILFNFLSSIGIPVTVSIIFNWKLGLTISSFIPFSLIWGFMQGQFLRGNQKFGAKSKKEISLIVFETTHNIFTVTLFNLQYYFSNKLKDLFKENFKSLLIVLLIEAFFYAIGYSLYFFIQCATFSYGIVLINKNEIEAKQMMFTFTSILFSSMFLGKNLSLLPDIPKAKKAAEWFFKIVNNDKPKIDASCDNGIKLEKLNGIIKFNNVQFGYPNRDNHLILKEIDLEFNLSKSYALVGKSGGGKSTCISLLQRFYDPSNGSVTLDDIDIKNLNVQWYRSLIGIVPQEPILFNCSIQDNIAYGLEPEKVKLEDIISAARKANAHDFIIKLPNAYNTIINASSTLNLSGGQKQRIAIARALIRKPKILLFDEATSALDNFNEKAIQSMIHETKLNQITITVAHRLSTIRNCDKIFVIIDGKVTEEGNHDNLLKNKKFYYELNSSNY